MIAIESTRAPAEACVGSAAIAAEPRSARRVSIKRLPALHFGAGFHYGGQILSGTVFNDIETTLFDGLGVHQFTADRHGAGARLQEFAGSFQVHAASRDHIDMR